MPDWAIVILSLVLNLVWIIPMCCVLFPPIIKEHKEKKEYWRKYAAWNKANPNKERLLCVKCKYCKTKSSYVFYHPPRGLRVYPMYCRLLKKNLQGFSYTTQVRCQIAEPTEEFCERGDIYYPEFDVYCSSRGLVYHSTPDCPSLKLAYSVHKTNNEDAPFGYFHSKKPCLKCCKIVDGRVLKKDIPHASAQQRALSPLDDSPTTPLPVPNGNQRFRMLQVKSSNIHSIGYTAEILVVRFHNSGTYTYRGVPKELVKALLNASSCCRFFNTYIRDRYPYEYVGGRCEYIKNDQGEFVDILLD